MIEIVGTEGSSEYRAAIMVRDALESSWPGVTTSPVEEDDIKIAVSVKISGYKIQDIDIVLGPVDNHLEAMSAATRFQHAA